MEPATPNLGQLLNSSKHIARKLFTIGENRLELLMVEVQEARELSLRVLLLALGVAIFSFLALLALNVAIVVMLWQVSPVGVLLGLFVVHALIAGILYVRLTRLMHHWELLAATREQIRKDRECLEKHLQ